MAPPEPRPDLPTRPSSGARAIARVRAAWPYWPLLPGLVVAALVVLLGGERSPVASPDTVHDAVRVSRLVSALADAGERLARAVLTKFRVRPDWLTAGHHRADAAVELRQFFIHKLEQHPTVEFIGFGRPGGDYLAVDRLGPNGGFRLVVRDRETKGRLFIYPMTAAGETNGTPDDKGEYDATTRPWYESVAGGADGDGEWGAPFVYATDPVLADNYSVPVYQGGQLAGVLTVSVSMRLVGQVLRENAPDGAAYVQQGGDRLLLAASGGGDPFYVTGNQTTRYTANQSPDPLVSRAAATLTGGGGGGGGVVFSHDGGFYDAAVVPQHWGREDWELVLARPRPPGGRPPQVWALAVGVLALTVLAVVRGRQATGFGRRWRSVRDTEFVGVIVWNPRFEVVDWSPGAEAVFAYSAGQMVGRDATPILPPDEAGQARVAKIWTDLIAATGPITSRNRNRRGDGRIIWCEWWNYPVRGPAGDLIEVVSVVRDATRERRLRRSAAAKSLFLATMSHELRTPLVTIDTALRNLRTRTPATLERDRTLFLADAAYKMCVRVIDQVLTFARGALRLTVKPRVFDLPETVETVVELARGQAPPRLVVDAFIDPATPRFVRGDDRLLQRVLLELVGNAVKYTDVGNVRVRVEPAAGVPDRVRVEVVDTGVGIAPADIHKLFRPFSRLDSTTRRKQPGTGLGLAIARQIVSTLGGEIAVESRLGSGSTFSFTVELPAAEAGPAPPPAPTARAGARVLLVEDDPYLGPTVVDHLRDRGLVVRLAATAQEALYLLGTEPFDLVIADCHLPEMDGFEMVRRLRDRERRKILGGPAGVGRVPVVGFSAGDAYEAKAAEAGMDAFVLKGSWDALDAALARHLAGPPREVPAVGSSGVFALPAAPLPDRGRGDLERFRNAAAPAYLADLERAGGNPERLQSLVHQIIGHARTIGLADVAAAAGRVRAELAVAGGDPGLAVADLRRLLAGYADLTGG